ncbi:MAG: hypothetical protein ACKOKF_00855, partial [Bacteroidota bacterium]
MGIALLACLFQSRTAYSAAQVNMYTDQCAAGTNFIEFRMMITNTSTAGETLYINTPGAWRMNYGSTMASATGNTFTFAYVAGSADPILAPSFATLGTNYKHSHKSSIRLLQATFG